MDYWECIEQWLHNFDKKNVLFAGHAFGHWKSLIVSVFHNRELKIKNFASYSSIYEQSYYFGVRTTFCFMSWTGDITAAFDKHVATFGGLDICINSAGVTTSVPFSTDQTDGTRTWRRTVDVNLIAIIDCTRLAVCFELWLGFASILPMIYCECAAYYFRSKVLRMHIFLFLMIN